MGNDRKTSNLRKSKYKHRNKELSNVRNLRKISGQTGDSFDVHWRPEDDYLLINSIYVTCNLAEVYSCVRFSRPYTQLNIENRWHSLLFNRIIFNTAQEAIKLLPPMVKYQLDRCIPFNSEEDSLLITVSYNDVFSNEEGDVYTVFDNLLHSNPSTFYSSRISADLYSQWNRFRRYNLISMDQQDETNTNPKPNTRDGFVKQQHLAENKSKLNSMRINNYVGGDPNSFSDTEFLLQETVAKDLQTGLSRLLEPTTVTRRQRMLKMSRHHGFQAAISQSFVDYLTKSNYNESLVNRKHDDKFSSFSLPRAFNRSKKLHLGHYESAERSSYTPGNLDNSSSSDVSCDDLFTENRSERHRLRKRLDVKMKRVAEEARRWTAFVESKVANGTVICDHQPIFPNLATLTGQKSRFLIKCKKVTFGRQCSTFSPDIDLSCEGEASQISRCHGQIYLTDAGCFWLTNFSKHPIFINGNPVLKGENFELRDMSIIYVSNTSLRFDIEHEYINCLLGLGSCLPNSSILSKASFENFGSSVKTTTRLDEDD